MSWHGLSTFQSFHNSSKAIMHEGKEGWGVMPVWGGGWPAETCIASGI